MTDTPAITSTTSTPTLFSTGQIVATKAVFSHLQQHAINALQYIERHTKGDWGDIPAEDALENIFAIENGFRILSSYTIADAKVWIITEADRSVTTLLFPSEY